MAEASDLKHENISKARIKEELTKFLDTDTLLYWESSGTPLRSKQEKYWGAALKEFSSEMKMPSLQITETLFEVHQDDLIKSRFDKFLSELNYFQLAGKS